MLPIHTRQRTVSNAIITDDAQPRTPKHPTARIVSQLGRKANDRAEAPTGGLCRTASWVHAYMKNLNLHEKP